MVLRLKKKSLSVRDAYISICEMAYYLGLLLNIPGKKVVGEYIKKLTMLVIIEAQW